MYQAQRLDYIQAQVAELGTVSAKDMMAQLKVSRDTIRRDFELLSQQGLVRRVHGGIMALTPTSPIESFNERLHDSGPQKEAIAEAALALIPEQAVIFMDASTITLQVAKRLEGPLTVYTHSLDVALLLSNKEGIKLHLLGGQYYERNHFFFDLASLDKLSYLRFDLVFMGAAGLANGEVSFVEEEDVLIKRLVKAKSKYAILLAEANKFDRQAGYFLAKLNEFDYWICDHQTPEMEKWLSEEDHLAVKFVLD